MRGQQTLSVKQGISEAEIRANSPVSNLVLVLKDVNLEPTQSSQINSRTDAELSAKFVYPESNIVQPVPVRKHPVTTLFSPEHTTTNSISSGKSQRRLFEKSPPTNSTTAIRRTQSDFGIGRIRKSLTFDGEEDSSQPLRDCKRPMHQSNFSTALAKHNENTTTTPSSDHQPQFVIAFSDAFQQSAMKENVPPFASAQIIPLTTVTDTSSLPTITTTTTTTTTTSSTNNNNNDSATPPSSAIPPPCPKLKAQSIASMFSPLPPSPTTSRRRRSFACGSTSQERLLPQAIKNNFQPPVSEHDINKDQPVLVLPVCETSHSLPYISAATMSNILNGEFLPEWEHVVIDCRYDYEFQGGHIRGAKNMKTPTEIDTEYLCSPVPTSRRLVIFHCEFSSHRGPTLCQHLRSRDRQLNLDSYPALYYPQLYVLKGGFKEFYEKYPELCEPSGYVPMLDPRYKEELRRTKNELRATSGSKVKRSVSVPNLRRGSDENM